VLTPGILANGKRACIQLARVRACSESRAAKNRPPHPFFVMRIAVLITSFNRKQKTLACLTSLFASPPSCELEVFLLDDASKDGTPEAVAASFPQVHLLAGDGSSFWSGGMRLAWKAAAKEHFDAFVLLNDDVKLDLDAFQRLVNWFERLGSDTLLGGPVRSSDTGAYTYGGNQRAKFHPWKFELAHPGDSEPVEVAVLNGNIMLIPDRVYQVIGNFPEYLIHQGGDFVYSLRAGRAGFKSLLLPGSYGVCDENPVQPLARGFKGLKRALAPKNLPVSYTMPLYKELAGVFWPFWWLVPYVRAFVVGF